jgi:hypothetical protein
VIVDGPEIEIGTVASEVAGIRRGMQTTAASEWHRHDESVGRKGGMYVKVAEQDLALAGTRRHRHRLSLLFIDNDCRGQLRAFNTASSLWFTACAQETDCC